MSNPSARDAGTFALGGDLEIARIGFGAMRIVGPGVWGSPDDPASVIRTLQRIPELGINFIDTADSYGPDLSEDLIRQALHPYSGIHIATKAGFFRPGPDQWIPRGDPDYLIAQARSSRERLGVDALDLWQLHRIDPTVPAREQFDAIKFLLDTGVIRRAGLSEVDVAQIKAASRVFPVATVQNRYNLVDRRSEAVLDYCESTGIGFIPWFPLSSGRLAGHGTPLDAIARKHRATSGQIALAWLLRRSKVIIPIPGTSNLKHLEENAAAARISLSDDDVEILNKASEAVTSAR
jgi:aryl-alcohol dehydrogenase-like predicted oxidoreductase